MSFVQEDILNIFEGLTTHLFKKIKGVNLDGFARISYDEAIKLWVDKPDIIFYYEVVELNDLCQAMDLASLIQQN